MSAVTELARDPALPQLSHALDAERMRLEFKRHLEAAERRGPASVAQTLYEDLTPPQPANRPLTEMRAGKRPTKRDRRRLDALRGGFI